MGCKFHLPILDCEAKFKGVRSPYFSEKTIKTEDVEASWGEVEILKKIPK